MNELLRMIKKVVYATNAKIRETLFKVKI